MAILTGKASNCDRQKAKHESQAKIEVKQCGLAVVDGVVVLRQAWTMYSIWLSKMDTKTQGNRRSRFEQLGAGGGRALKSCDTSKSQKSVHLSFRSIGEFAL